MSSAQPLPEVYRRRQPEATALYQCVQEHLDELATRLLPETLPAFVERELSAFLTCGILAYGFARVRCTGCGFDRLVAFACKGRGLCPSCVGRRMAETSAYLVEHVFPEDAPVRQWVLSLPKPVRALVAYDASLLGEVLSIFVSSVRQHLRRVAKQELGLASVTDAHTACVTAIQRFGSAAELNVHLHSLVCDGVFVKQAGELVFRALPEPSPRDIAHVAEHVCARVTRLLERRGLWVNDASAAEPTLLEKLGASSVQGTLVFSSSHRPMRLLGAAARTVPKELRGYSFDVDASVRVPGHDKQRLERLCRYILRPPIANDRLRKLPDGRFELRLKKPWSDGTTHLVFDGVELLARLVALIPPPRVHMIRYHGVFAPRSRLRAQVVRAIAPEPCEPHEKPKSRLRLDWAKLLLRVFEVDVLTCPRCESGRLQRIAFITSGDAIRAILTSVGLSTAPPERRRVPAQVEMAWL